MGISMGIQPPVEKNHVGAFNASGSKIKLDGEVRMSSCIISETDSK